MTKQDIQKLTNEELVDHFDNACSKLTKEANSKGGETKKTQNDFELTRAELLKRLNG